MTEEKNDYSPIVNLASGLGTKKDSTTQSVAVRPFYNYEHYNIFYRSSWACRRVVEALPRLMCRRWGKFTFASRADKSLSDFLDRRHRELKVRNNFKLAQYWANLHGRAYILIVTSEEDYSQPINIYTDKIKQLLVLDKNKIYPDLANGNYSVLYPENYVLRSFNKIVLPSNDVKHFRVHKSRLLVFRGNELPDDEKIRENGAEASTLEPFVNVWIRYFSSSASLSHLLNNVDIFVHYIDGFIELMQQGGADATTAMQARLEANLLFRSSYRGYMADKSKELIKYESRNLGGVAPIDERMESQLVAASGLPRSVLLGQFSAGLDASGKITGEQRFLNELVEEGQKDKFEDNLRELNSLLWLEKNAPVEPDGWGWKWIELYGESKKEAAEIFKIYSEADKTNIESGIYRPDEARSRHNESEFNTEIILDEEREESLFKTDDATPVKKIIEWQGFKIGLQYLPFEQRHGKTLKAGYGHFRNTVVDVYVGTNLESDKIFCVEQFIDGMFDKEKMVIGVSNIKEAEDIYLSAMAPAFMGGIKEISIDNLKEYRKDTMEKLLIDGDVLTDAEISKIAEFGDADLNATLTNWQQTAPDKYKNLLNS